MQNEKLAFYPNFQKHQVIGNILEKIIEGWRNVLTKKADAKSEVSAI